METLVSQKNDGISLKWLYKKVYFFIQPFFIYNRNYYITKLIKLQEKLLKLDFL